MEINSEIFVGRDNQVQQLRAIAHSAFTANKTKIVFLTGEAGIGKTTLGERFKNLIQYDYSSLKYAYANCSDKTGTISSYLPFIQIHQKLLEPVLNNKVKRGETWKNWLREYTKDVGPEILDILPFLGPALKIGVKTYFFTKDRGDAKQSDAEYQIGIFQAFVDSLNFLANKNPLLLFIDDWHWADDSSTNLLFYLSRQLKDAPLLLMATFRPHEAHARQHPILKIKAEMQVHNDCTEISLDFLTKRAIKEYLLKRLKTKTINPAFINWLEKVTKGNVLFLEAFVELILAEKIITSSGRLKRGWQNVRTPIGIESVVFSRAQYLSDQEREILNYGAIEGQEFSTLFLERVTKSDRLTVLKSLRKIQLTHQLISEIGPSLVYKQNAIIYKFNHETFQQTFYKNLSTGEKIELSRLLLELQGEYYEKADEITRSKMLPQMLILAEIASDYLALAKYALKATEEAQKTYGHAEVIKQCHAGLFALNNLEDSPQIIELKIQLLTSRAYTTWRYIGTWKDALDDYNQIELLAKKLNSPQYLADAYYYVGEIHLFRDEYDLAINALKKAANINNLDQTQLSKILDQLAEACLLSEDYDQALNWAKKVLALREEINDKHSIALALLFIGIIHITKGENEIGLEWLNKAIEIVHELGVQDELAVVYNQIGYLQIRARKVDEQTMKWFHKAAEINKKKSDDIGVAINYHNIGSAYRILEKYNESLEWYRKVVAIREKVKDLRNLAITWKIMGEISETQNDLPSALEYLKRSIDIFDQIGLPNDAREVTEKLSEIDFKLSKSIDDQ